MIDLHAHILPDVDDGPVDIEESLEMIRGAWSEGIDTICATPHVLKKSGQEVIDLFTDRLEHLKEEIAAEGLPVKVLLGSEIYFQPDMGYVKDHSLLTLNGTGKYFLMEFPMHNIPAGADKVIFNMVMNGAIPIVAHPERNLSVVKNEAILDPFLHSGTLVQINSGSLEGRFGRGVKKRALSLLKRGAVHFIGSDAHNATSRPISLRPAMEIASQIIGTERAELLVSIHPEKILSGEPLPPGSLYRSDGGEEANPLLNKIWKGLTGK